MRREHDTFISTGARGQFMRLFKYKTINLYQIIVPALTQLFVISIIKKRLNLTLKLLLIDVVIFLYHFT